MSTRLAATIALLAIAGAAGAEDAKTMGKCGPEKKEGNECAVGICYAGKQTVYTCAKDRTCTKSEQQKACDVKAK